MQARANRACLFALVAAIWCLCASRPVSAFEEIRSFHAEVQVNSNGVLYVRETIRYALDPGLYKRGIFRDFPLTSPTARGGRKRVTFTVLSVKRDGQPEHYSILDEDGHARVQIGRSRRYLGIDRSIHSRRPSVSEHIYEIYYRTDGQLRAFEEYDELYWNVTGHRWDIPIQSASVTIILPDTAPVLQHSAYTGPIRAQTSGAKVIEVTDGHYSAETITSLAPGEGFTVAVAWPKGVVPANSTSGMLGFANERLAAIAATLLGTLALLLCWLAVGRDPREGVIYPEFQPPKGLGPAAIRYLSHRGYDDGCLTAAIVSMAVKGALRIVERPSTQWRDGHSLWLEPLTAPTNKLTPAERATYRRLFPTGKDLELVADEANGRRMDKARSTLRAMLREEHYGTHFLRNTIYTLVSTMVGVFAAAVLVRAWQSDGLSNGQFGHWLAAAIFAALLASGIAIFATAFGSFRSGGLRVPPLPISLWGGLGVVGYFLPELAGRTRGLFEGPVDTTVVCAGAAFGLFVALFHVLMSAPTRAGRQLLDRIQGFALYLGTAEAERLNFLNPPERTPELFERFLPYAIALDVTHAWSTKFAGVLSDVTVPQRYQGSRSFSLRMLDHRLGSALASTSVPTRSGSFGGSGSGSGGFSGGGGGGGGGGSW